MPPKRADQQQKLSKNEEEELRKSKEAQEERRKRIEEERVRRLAEERKSREEEEKRAASARRVEEEKRRAEEEERVRREQQERERKRIEEQKKMEEQKRLEEQLERKRKMEEERRKQLEQQMKQAEEEKRRLAEERRKKEEEEEKLLQELRKGEAILQIEPAHAKQPTYDLLGAASDNESEPDQEHYHGHQGHHGHHDRRVEENYYTERYSDYSSNYGSEGPYTLTHRQQPTRGEIDDVVDRALDSLQPIQVAVTKNSKKDGTYIFGTRLLKAQVRNGEAVVTVGAKTVPLAQFVRQYEKVESVKLRGLQSALPLCTMLGSKSVNIKA